MTLCHAMSSPQVWANRAWLDLWNKKDLAEYRAARGEEWSEARRIGMQELQKKIDRGDDAWQNPV